MVVQVPNQPRIDLTEHKLFTLRQQRRSLFNQSERNLIDAIFPKFILLGKRNLWSPEIT